MITKKNLKDALLAMGFGKHGDNEFIKTYGSLDKTIVVDFARETITWPAGLQARDDTTSNFSAPENFVVLECVDRLLSKGYRPEHLVLEEKWQLGHEQKGGKADICVYDADNRLLLIIECKTAGEEFRKYKKQLFQDGGQLFSYWQQDRSAQWLCLYASDLTKADNETWKISYADSMVVVNCQDDKNLEKTAEADESIHLYRHAHSVEQLFQVWDETYNKQTYPDVIFGTDSQPYQIGIRPIKKKDLRQFSAEDGIVNRFLEILRHNNVSDRENAFNKLVSLFVCKLVDEVTKDDEDEMAFQYRAISDSYEDLQDRLQRLYRDGMKEFMGEKIFYVESDYADKLFAQYTGAKRRRAISELHDTIRKLKFYSNNEFAFKDVHNEDLFLQNGKILVEVVQLFEPYKIVYTERNQLLGDLFEQLLAKGFKQNEGQFFTAMPITRFIWDSLPLARIVRHGAKLRHPRIIDYACGAGHFLTEAVEAVNACIAAESGKPAKDNAWVEKCVYGVEKDYRLARVSKVSLHMNGAGKGQIAFGDGLENYPERGIENGRFDILVANPPYCVEAFKSHLKLKNNTLELLDSITNQGSEIEVLFVERVAQLLKPRGLAAIILPSSILTTGEGPYVGARGELIDNFNIRAIVGLGKNAFQATSTETVILFLEKYDEPPKRASMVADSVDAILSGNPPADWEDRSIFDAYIAHVGVNETDYLDFVARRKTWTAWQGHDYFGAYVKAFDALREFRDRRNRKAFLQLPQQEQEAAISGWFYDYWLGGVEREKLTIFGLVYQQKTLIVKSPDDKNEERKFLGYSWSNRRGQEGIKIEHPGGLMYDAANRNSNGVISSGIRASFDGLTPSVEIGGEYVHFVPFKNLIDFSRAQFDKTINIDKKKSVGFESHFPLVPLSECVEIVRGVTYAKEDQVVERTNVVILTADNITLRGGFDVRKEVFLRASFKPDKSKKLKKGDCFICLSSGSRQHIGKVAYIDSDTDYYAGGFMGILRAIPTKCDPRYIYEILNSTVGREVIRQECDGSNIKNLSNSIGEIKIPIPPIDIQKKIAVECARVDTECAKERKAIADAQDKISGMMRKVIAAQPTRGGGGGWVCGDLGDFLEDVKDASVKVAAKLIARTGAIPVVTQEDGTVISGYVDGVEPINDLPLIVFGDHTCVFKYVDFPFVRGADGTQLLKFQPQSFDAKFMWLYLKECDVPNANSYERHMKYLKTMRIAVPPLNEQRRIVMEVEKIEKQIADAEAKATKCVAEKSVTLVRYLTAHR